MSTRVRGLQKESSLPEEPKWVVIEATDGDARRWPMNTSPNPDAEGHVNFMLPVPLDDGAAIKWRMTIGQALAEMLGYPDLGSRSWVLKDWPEGYQFYDHHKGQLNGAIRHDLYLVGSVHVGRFRSPPEFIPHAYWLMTDADQDRSKCTCKYCTKIPQREISGAMGLSQRQGGSPARFADLPRRQERRRHALHVREGRVFATVRRASKPVKLPKGPKQHVNPEREKDLRAILSPKTLGERRWAREGELVWVKLDYPVPVNERIVDSEGIQFWPGIIEEVNFKAEATARRTHDVMTGNVPRKTSVSYSPNDDKDPWIIVHKSVYKIKLLVASKTVIYGSDHILPYQSHAPDGNLLSEVQSVVFDLDDDALDSDEMVLPSDELQNEQAEHTLFKRFQTFDPFLPVDPCLAQIEERRRYCETAAGAFATAIQIASRLTMYWTPCDAWEYKMQAPYDSLDVWSTSQSSLAPAELQALTQRTLGTETSNNGAIITQMRFQGLWWGPERIWMGDLVRLKLGRYQLAPEGTEMIKKPSGTGKHGLLEASVQNGSVSNVNSADVEMKDESDVGTIELGAAPRSLFLRVDGIFAVQVATEDGQGQENECRMCGMLYELADDDWEPEGEEYGNTATTRGEAMLNGSKVSQNGRSSGGTMATPLRAVFPNKVTPPTTNAINGTAPGPTLLPSSSSGLFAPNPDLLSEPPIQAYLPAAGNRQLDHSIEQEPAPSALLPSSSAIPLHDPASEPVTAVDTLTPKTESAAPANFSLSGPLKSAESVYPTPPPPSSLKFRPILRDGHEVVMPLTTLAGRYYPGLLSNSLLQERVHLALQSPEARESKAIRALEGLVPGVFNAVDSSYFLPRRSQMLREAENVAWKELVSYWRRRTSQIKNAVMIDDN